MHLSRLVFVAAFVLPAALGQTPTVAPRASPPAGRSRALIADILARAEPAPANPRVLRILLVAGPKDHGPGEHDYPAWQKAWAPLLAKSPRVSIDTAFPWPQPQQFDAADLAVFYLHTRWDASQLAELQKFQSRGGGVVTIHWAIGADELPLRFADRVGLAYPAAKYRHGILDLKLVTDHPITRGLPATVRLTDESYWPLVGDSSRIRVLASSDENAGPGNAIMPVPVFWTYQPTGGGRAFVCIPGHYMWTFDDPLFRLLLLRGMAWAAGESVSRFNSLVLDGASLADP